MGHPTLGHLGFDGASDGDDSWSVAIAGDTIVEESSPPEVGDDLASAVADADLAVANLEAPVPPDDASPIHKIGPVNETAAETPGYLRAVGFDAVTLANNHTMDYGRAGLERTVEACAAADLGTCGADTPDGGGVSTLTRSIAGQSVTVLNLCEREFGVASDAEPGTAWLGRPGVERGVEAAADAADVLLVVVHGGIEYVPLPPPQLQARLRSLADAGADLVVGHHPHVPQGWEEHAGTPIFYSVGNFRYTRCCRPKTEWGLLLSATFDSDDLAAVDLHPVERLPGDGVAFMGERWDPDRFQPYLDTACDVVADRDRLRAHWQEQAIRVFEQRYSAWLRAAAGSDTLSILRHPGRYLGRAGLWDPDDREHEMLLLLNLVRNESHRAVIETAMAVRGGRREDARTPVVRERVADLLETTEDKPVDPDATSATDTLRTLSAHLSEKAGQLQRRLLGRHTSREA